MSNEIHFPFTFVASFDFATEQTSNKVVFIRSKEWVELGSFIS